MRRYLIIALIFLFIAAFALVALATPIATATAPSWNEHSDLMTILIGMLITLVCFFMIRTLAKIDRNQSRLFEKLDALSSRVDTLQGEHNVMRSLCSVRKTSAERPD